MNRLAASCWVYQEDLKTVFKHLHAIQQNKPSLLRGELMADVVKRLVSCEVRPGGPYRSVDGVDTPTNLSIYTFMVMQGVTLLPLEQYLSLHLKNFKPMLKEDKKSTINNIQADRDGVFKAVHAKAISIKTPLFNTLVEQVDRIWKVDTSGEIALLSKLFSDSLAMSEDRLSPSYTLELGISNVYSWIAYTIYDEVIDDHSSHNLIPVANLAMRRALQNYQSVVKNFGAKPSILEDSFTEMDAANIWELRHCRFGVEGGRIKVDAVPDYGDRRILALRALAHIAGPMAQIDYLSYATLKQKKSAIAMLEHYLIARQLNDDIHDWQEDLSSGQITYAVSVLLKMAQVQPGVYKISELSERLRQCFWENGLVTISNTIVTHTAKSKACLRSSILFRSECAIWSLVHTIEGTATKGLASHDSSKAFLVAFAKDSLTMN